MRYQTTGVAIVAFCFSTASAQTPPPQNVDRVFHLTQNETARDLQEMATTLRAVADIRQVASDATSRTVTVAETAAQMAMAEWLIHELDVPALTTQPQQFVVPGTSNDVVRVYFTHAATPQGLQEIVTTIRSVSDVQRIFAIIHCARLCCGEAQWKSGWRTG